MRRLVAAMALLLLGACSGPGTPPSAAPEPPPASPSRTLPPAPATHPNPLDRLPVGAPPLTSYTLHGVLHVGDRAYRLPDPRVDLVEGSGFVLARERKGGRITAYDRGEHRSRLIATTSRGVPAAVPGHRQAAVPTTGREARVDLVDFERRRRVEDSQVFPVPCCDGDLAVEGVTQFGEVVVSSSDGAWWWSAFEGQEGTPYPVPDVDTSVGRFDLPPRGRIAQVDPSEIVVTRPFRHQEANPSLVYEVRDTPDGRRLTRTGSYRFKEAVIEAGGRRAAHRYSVVGVVDVVDLPSMRSVRMGLPARTSAGEVGWEQPRSVMIDAYAPQGRRALVRCDARTGACELAAELDRGSVTAL